MQWAKAQSLSPVTHHLGLSGLAPPPPELLPLERLLPDLEQRGRHVPPVLARRMRDRLGVGEGELMLTLGTSHALYLLAAAHLQPGDRCLVERPAYATLATLPTLFGAEVERFERELASGWRPPPDLPARIRARRPRMILLSNPHNPTGVRLTREELAPLVEAAEEVGALLVVDEVYLEYELEPAALTAFGMRPCVATASSFTKAFGLGTIRCGWLTASESVVARALRYNDYIAVLYPNPSAWVALAALDALGPLKERAHRISHEHRDIVDAFVAARPELRWCRPDTGVIGFIELPIPDATPFCERLVAERQTLVVPGRFFEAPRFVRVGFGGDRAVLTAGLDRLGAALDAL